MTETQGYILLFYVCYFIFRNQEGKPVSWLGIWAGLPWLIMAGVEWVNSGN